MLEGKYRSRGRFGLAKLRRAALRAAVRPLVRWRPIVGPREGFTVVVACHARLAEVVIPSLRLLAAQDLDGLDRTLVVLDAPEDDRLRSFAARVAAEFPALRIECLYQTPLQSRVLRAIGWGWVDCWLSYCKGLAEVRTRRAMLHDMDAMLLDPSLVRRRMDALRDSGAAFLGVQWYAGNGVEPGDRLAYIVEIALDAEHLRRSSRPIDSFNVVTTLGGRTADLDILLYPQLRARRSEVLPIGEGEWVHPSQVVSQFTYLNNDPGYVPPPLNNLWFIPYFLDLSGSDPVGLDRLSDDLLASGGPTVPFLGRVMDLSRLTRTHLRWVTKVVVRLERAFHGSPRPSVRRYLDAIRSRCEGGRGGSLLDEVEPELDREYGAAATR